MKLSFVIPHKGREDMLKLTLASIASQIDHGIECDVIIVTQNRRLSDETLSFASRLNIQVIVRPETETISRLRNIGCENSNAEYLAFIDADVQLAPNWVVEMMQELQADPRRKLVSAVQESGDGAPVLEKIRTVLGNASADSNVEFLSGRNLLLSRETFDRVGGFPEHLVTCEDYFFTNSVSQHGMLFFSSRSNYVHLGEDKQLGEMFLKEIWRGQSNLQSIRSRSIPLREIPSFIVPLWIAFFLCMALVSLLMGGLAFAATAFLLAVLPVALYSFRLYRLSEKKIKFIDIFRFYSVYFPARIYGTLVGAFKIIKI